jgi:CRISPR system Cascade subunit CasE
LGWAADDGESEAEPVPAAWLKRQGGKAGFTVEAAVVLGYRQLRLRRDGASGRRGNDLRFSTVDLEGALTVTEPSVFLAAIRQGFGKAKAFGCGLMLIRRA